MLKLTDIKAAKNVIKKRGINYILLYFKEIFFFDLIRGTDTYERIGSEDYQYQPHGFDNNIWYVPSETRIIVNALEKIKNIFGKDLQNYQFLDLGCGKGKTLLVYCEKFKNQGISAIGIEYYEPLANIAMNNMKKCNYQDRVKIITDDAGSIAQHTNEQKLIIYMYNSFGEHVMRSVLSNIQSREVIIIYIDPRLSNIIEEYKFRLIDELKGKFPNSDGKIFQRKLPINPES